MQIIRTSPLTTSSNGRSFSPDTKKIMGGPHGAVAHHRRAGHGAGTHSPTHHRSHSAGHHIIQSARRKLLFFLVVFGVFANRAPMLYDFLARMGGLKSGGATPPGSPSPPGTGANTLALALAKGLLGVVARFFAGIADKLSSSRNVISRVWPPSVELIVRNGGVWTGSLAALVVLFYTRSLRQGGRGLEASISDSMRFERSERRKACLEVIRLCIMKARMLHLCYGLFHGEAEDDSPSEASDSGPRPALPTASHVFAQALAREERGAGDDDDGGAQAGAGEDLLHLLAVPKDAEGFRHVKTMLDRYCADILHEAEEDALEAVGEGETSSHSTPPRSPRLALSQSGFLLERTLSGADNATLIQTPSHQLLSEKFDVEKYDSDVEGGSSSIPLPTLSEERPVVLEPTSSADGGTPGSATPKNKRPRQLSFELDHDTPDRLDPFRSSSSSFRPATPHPKQEWSLESLPTTADEAYRCVETLARCAPADVVLRPGAMVVACLLKLELRKIMCELKRARAKAAQQRAEAVLLRRREKMNKTPSRDSLGCDSSLAPSPLAPPTPAPPPPPSGNKTTTSVFGAKATEDVFKKPDDASSLEEDWSSGPAATLISELKLKVSEVKSIEEDFLHNVKYTLHHKHDFHEVMQIYKPELGEAGKLIRAAYGTRVKLVYELLVHRVLFPKKLEHSITALDEKAREVEVQSDQTANKEGSNFLRELWNTAPQTTQWLKLVYIALTPQAFYPLLILSLPHHASG